MVDGPKNPQAETNTDAGGLPPAVNQAEYAATGIAGLDAVLGGGLPRNHT